MLDHKKQLDDPHKGKSFISTFKKFLGHEHFFHHLILHGCISLILVIGSIAAISCTHSLWEGLLFPSSKKIESLEHDLILLQNKVEQQKKYFQDSNGKEIENLKIQLINLRQSLESYEKKTFISQESDPFQKSFNGSIKFSSETQALWEEIQSCLNKGENCLFLVEQFENKAKEFISLRGFLNELRNFARMPPKPLKLLQGNLECIVYNLRKFHDSNEKLYDQKNQGWISMAWNYLSTWIKIRPLESIKADLLADVLQSAMQGDFSPAINKLQNQNHQTEIKVWLNEANYYQKCKVLIDGIDKVLEKEIRDRGKP